MIELTVPGSKAHKTLKQTFVCLLKNVPTLMNCLKCAEETTDS